MRNSKVKGFTLVELIVVIAIIAILAAILVPSMLGYIRNSRITQADANAKNVHTAATAAVAQAYVDGKLGAAGTITQITEGPIKKSDMKVKVNSKEIDLTTGLGTDFKGIATFWYDSGSYAVTAAAWTANESETLPSTVATTRNKAANPIIGWYPAPADET